MTHIKALQNNEVHRKMICSVGKKGKRKKTGQTFRVFQQLTCLT